MSHHVCASSYYSKLCKSMFVPRIREIMCRRMKKEEMNTKSPMPNMFNDNFLPISVPVIRCSHPITLLLPIHNGGAPFNASLHLSINLEQGLRLVGEAAFCVVILCVNCNGQRQLVNPRATLTGEPLHSLETCSIPAPEAP